MCGSEWDGTKCGKCPPGTTPAWRGRDDCTDLSECVARGKQPRLPDFKRSCKDPKIAKENEEMIHYGIVVFLLVCCCGLCKTNRSLSVELSEARQHEVQKLVLENFEDHARRVGLAATSDGSTELQMNVELLTNPVALGEYVIRDAAYASVCFAFANA